MPIRNRILHLALPLIAAAASCCAPAESTGGETQSVQESTEQSESAAPESATPGSATPEASDPNMSNWAAGGTIPSGREGVKPIEILEVRNNGAGKVCGVGRSATLKYTAMLANGDVLDPGRRPFTFVVGSGRAISGWDVVVSKMRVGDDFTVMLPQELAYGPSKGDLKFHMQLLSVE